MQARSSEKKRVMLNFIDSVNMRDFPNAKLCHRAFVPEDACIQGIWDEYSAQRDMFRNALHRIRTIRVIKQDGIDIYVEVTS